jgi:hypothetical protein
VTANPREELIMIFRDFDIPKVQTDFGLQVDANQSLFGPVSPIAPDRILLEYLERYGPVGLANATEKARSELLVAPLLAEVWHRTGRKMSLLSGVTLDVDAAAGLTGICDFVISRAPQMLFLVAPVLVVVEAKRDSIVDGLGQCAAEMVAAQRFNQNAGKPIDPMYGCVTTGSVWKFLRLTGQQLDIDIDEYSISQPDRILGVLLHCCAATP